MGRKVWTKDDIIILKRLFPERHTKDLVEILYRTPQAISVKASKLGLAKKPEIIMFNGFRKGYTPFNKGRKMEEWLSPAVHEKIKWNQARTADRNRAAALPDGSRRHRYNGEYIKVEGQWIRLAHHVWIQANGPIPDGSAIYFRDGDFNNAALENLYIGPKNFAPFTLSQKTPEERQRIHSKMWETRRRDRDSELDKILAEIRKSENNIYYKPQI